jgi:cysteinyl-tRNA synthetase
VTLGVLDKIDSVLAIGEHANGTPADDTATDLCRQIDAARAGKDFATADRLRKELQEAGYDVQTTRDGTTARRKLA